MPLYEYQCRDCDKSMEILLSPGDKAKPECRYCGSKNLTKLLSAPSSMSGVAKNRLPGAGDTGCCGISTDQATCAGPGSCCGRAK